MSKDVKTSQNKRKCEDDYIVDEDDEKSKRMKLMKEVKNDEMKRAVEYGVGWINIKDEKPKRDEKKNGKDEKMIVDEMEECKRLRVDERSPKSKTLKVLEVDSRLDEKKSVKSPNSTKSQNYRLVDISWTKSSKNIVTNTEENDDGVNNPKVHENKQMVLGLSEKSPNLTIDRCEFGKNLTTSGRATEIDSKFVLRKPSCTKVETLCCCCANRPPSTKCPPSTKISCSMNSQSSQSLNNLNLN